MVPGDKSGWPSYTRNSNGRRTSSILRTSKGVDGFESSKPAKVAISGDELGNTVFEAEGNDVSIVNQIACGTRLTKRRVEHGGVSPRFCKQKEGRRSQQLFQVFQCNVQRNRRVEDSRMSNNPEELVNARPGDCPWLCSFGEVFQDLACRVMVLARLNFSIDEDVSIDCLHRLAPIHEIEQGVPVKQVHARLFRSFPTVQPQLIGLLGTGKQGAAEKVIGYRLERAAFFGGLSLQFAKKLIIDRQSGSCHMQKHISYASRCQRPVASRLVMRGGRIVGIEEKVGVDQNHRWKGPSICLMSSDTLS